MKLRGRYLSAWRDHCLNWHRHFAWWPVPVGNFESRWLETVERKYRWVGASGTPYEPEYRSIKA